MPVTLFAMKSRTNTNIIAHEILCGAIAKSIPDHETSSILRQDNACSAVDMLCEVIMKATVTARVHTQQGTNMQFAFTQLEDKNSPDFLLCLMQKCITALSSEACRPHCHLSKVAGSLQGPSIQPRKL